MRKQNLEFKFTELEHVYNNNEKNDTSLLVDIKSSNEEPFSLSPAFESEVERYCWVPKNNSDVLNLDFIVKKDTQIFFNNELSISNNFKIFAKEGPKEYKFVFQKDDGIAKYSVVCLPTNFPPLNINISNLSMVSEGHIFTSVFIVPKIVHWPLIIKDVIKYFPDSKKYYIKYLYQNIRTRIKIPKIVKHQTEKKLIKSRKYLPYIMLLDKFGVPIWYKMAGIGFSAFRPYRNGYYYGAVSNYPQFAIGLGKTVLLDKEFNINGFKQITEKDIYTELHEFQYLDDGTIIQIGSKTHKYKNQNVDSGIISIENKQKGSIVSILATWVWTGSPFVIPSAMSKSGINAMTKSLAVEWGQYGIRLNAIAPGPFPTEGAWSRLMPQTGDSNKDEKVSSQYMNIPLQRAGEMEELGNLATFLMADGCEYLTGQTIAIDGAQYLSSSGTFANLNSLTDEDWDNIRNTIKKSNEKDKKQRSV